MQHALGGSGLESLLAYGRGWVGGGVWGGGGGGCSSSKTAKQKPPGTVNIMDH